MKKKSAIIHLTLLLFIISCSRNLHTEQIYSEHMAVKKMADEIYTVKSLLTGKNLAIFTFTNLEGKETPQGARLARKVLEQLVQKGGLTFIERSELAKIIKALGIEHSGLIDHTARKKIGNVYNIHIMFTGSISQVAHHAELAVKAVNINTGVIHFMKTIRFIPAEGLIHHDDPDRIKLHRKKPETLRIMNLAYNILLNLKQKNHLAFLLAVSSKNDPDYINSPELVEKLKHALRQLKNNDPENYKRFLRLRKGIQLLKIYDKTRYAKIITFKKQLIKTERNL